MFPNKIIHSSTFKAIKYGFTLLLTIVATNKAQAWAPVPTNDDWANAYQITDITDYCSTNSEFTNIAATTDGPQPTAFAWSQNVWFKFTPTATGEAYILLKRGTIRYARMALYKLVNGALQEEVSTDYFSQYGKNWLHVTGLDQSSEYYLGVDNLGGTTHDGTFSLCVKDTQDNDFADQALDINDLMNACSANNSYSNSNASGDGPQASNLPVPYSNVWFKFDATASGIANIVVKRGGVRFIYLALFRKNSQGQLVEVTSESHKGQFAKNWIHATGLTSGETYYLSVDIPSNTTYQGGDFSICIKDQNDNDFADQALDINNLMNTCSPDHAYTTVNATGDGPQASNLPAPYSNVWFKFDATASGIANIVVKRGGIILMQLALFEKDQQGQLVEVTSKTHYAQYGKNWIHASGLESGKTYYLSVDNLVYSTSQGGSFSVCLKDYNDFDFWEFAEDVTSLINNCSPNAAYSTINATGDGPKPDNHPNQPYNNVWFKFNATTDFIKTVVSGMEYVQLAIFEEVNGSLVHFGSRSYYARFGKNWLTVDNLTMGDTYYISVGGVAVSHLQGGNFKICLVDTPDHDFKEYALELTLTNNIYNPTGVTFDSKLMSGDGVKPANWSTQPFANSWFKFDLDFQGDLTIDIDRGSVEYIRAALYDANGNELVSGQASRWGSLSFPDIDLAAGEYHLSIGNVGLGHTMGGSFSIDLFHTPNIQCTTELWAIASGAWDDPNTWSDTEGGQPVSAIPCQTTVVHIKGFDVSFNSSGIMAARRVEVMGTNIGTVTRLNIQTGELHVIEEVITSGAGVELKTASGARVKVTGDE